MASFNDVVAADLAVLFNTKEFAEIHNIGGRELPVIIDNDRLKIRTQKEYEGIYVGDLLFYVAASDFGAKPKPGKQITFDNVPHEVFEASEDNGVYEIILRASEN